MIHELLICVGGLLAALIFLLLFSLREKAGPAGVRTYSFVAGRLREKKGGILDYGRLTLFLKKNGAPFLFGKWADPVRYMGLGVLCALAGAVAGLRLHPAAALILTAVGAYLPNALLLTKNSQDNDRLMKDIKLVYRFLAVQTGAGVYLTDALVECYQAVGDRRLKTALWRLSNELAISGDAEKALKGLQESFDNPYVDTLCTVLEQAAESGQTIDLLKDISEQLRDVEENLLYKAKERLERKIAMLQLLFFAGIVAAVLYACVSEIWQYLAGF